MKELPQGSITPAQYATIGALLVVMFGLGIAAGWSSHPTAASQKSLREEGYTYIRPLLLCNVDPQPQNEDKTLEQKISSLIHSAATPDIGVYYVNPTAGKWAGVNPNASFSPASMLKVPVMVAVLRVAEENPALLQSRIYYSGSFDDNALETIKPADAVKTGRSYSVDQLLSYMITNSDNNATHLLQDALTTEQFNNIYTDLGLDVPSAGGPVDFMSAKAFTLFLRVLYNSTYLSHELSEKALALMAQSDFAQGLKSGVPAGVLVADKFGEREVAGDSSQNELHDCGVVYAQKGAYLLCVMTRGADTQTLAKEISSISGLVYDYVGH